MGQTSSLDNLLYISTSCMAYSVCSVCAPCVCAAWRVAAVRGGQTEERRVDSAEDIHRRLVWRRSYLNEIGTSTATHSFIPFAFSEERSGPPSEAHYLRKCEPLRCQISLKSSLGPLFTPANRSIYLYCVAADVCLLKLIHIWGTAAVQELTRWIIDFKVNQDCWAIK